MQWGRAERQCRRDVRMTKWDQLFVGGQWVTPASDQRIEVHSPATLELVGWAPEAVEADVDAAVAAARQAFDQGPWPTMDPADRKAVLDKFAALLTERIGEV